MFKAGDYLFSILLTVSAVLIGYSFSVFSSPLFSLVVVVGVVIGILSVFNIKLALGILLVSMLFSPELAISQLPNRAVVIRIDDILIILVFIIWLSIMALNKNLPLIRSTPINKYIFYYIAACLLFTGKGVIAGDVNFVRASFYILKYLEYFIIFWMFFNVIETEKDIKYFMMFAGITAVAVILYTYTLIDKIPAAPFDDEPGTLGGYFLIVISVCLGMLIYSENRNLKLGSLLVILLMIPVIMKAKSRATYASLFPLYFAFLLYAKKARKYIVLGLIVVVPLIPVLVRDIYREMVDRLMYTFTGTYGTFNLEPSAAARLITWQDVLSNNLPQKPFMGWGITGIRFIDSQYVRTLMELGVIGLALFVILLTVSFREAKKTFHVYTTGWKKGVAIGFMVSHISLLFHAIGGNTFIIVRIMEPYWFLLAIVIAIRKIDNKLISA